MDLRSLAAIRTADGVAALVSATALAGGDPLTAASALRARGIASDLASTALTQAELRLRAAGKFGGDAGRMLFTRDGYEQATRAEVARRRAARLAQAGATHVADLGCGMGADTLAFARAGLRVSAVDADEVTATIAEFNVAALELSANVDVRHRTAETFDLSTVDAAFCDPARRRGSARVFDPRAFSPPWEFVLRLIDTVPRTVLKLAPGIDHARIPAGGEGQWVSVDGDVVEAAFWCGPLASVPRRATLLTSSGTSTELVGSGERVADIGRVGRYIYDPDGAVVRSHLVAEFADSVGGRLADPTIAYVYADAFTPTPLGRGYEILDVMPFSLKRLRIELRTRGIGRLTIKKRGSALEPSQLRRDLRLSGTNELTIILTRVAGAPTVLLAVPGVP